ncbi:SKIP5-like protein [Capsicum annuum]|nr:SKIP5-like protein [Capsicum annuum]
MGKRGRYSYGKFGHKIKECPYDKKRSKDVCSQIQATNSVAQSGHLVPPQVASSSTSSGYLQNQFYALPSYHEYESSPDVVTTFEWKVSSMSPKARFISYLKSKKLISKWLVVDSVADIVDYWITFNEPHVFCMLTYCAGAWPGGNPDMLEVATSALPTGVFNQTMNWIAIAHSKAYDYIHEKRFPSTPYAFLFSIQGTMRFFISPSCLKRRTNHRFDNMNTAQAYCITMAGGLDEPTWRPYIKRDLGFGHYEMEGLQDPLSRVARYLLHPLSLKKKSAIQRESDQLTLEPLIANI